MASFEREKLFPRFLEILKAALRGEKIAPDEDTRKLFPQIYRLATEQNVLPLIADCLFDETQKGIALCAREVTVKQAQRMADFLLLLRALEEHGLKPAVIKGIVCRSLYPVPELRPSTDEDLLIDPEEYQGYRKVLQENGFCTNRDEDDYEVMFVAADRDLALELHKSLFPEESEAYGDCGRFFEGALARAEDRTIGGVTVRTLSPTDHLLFLICHAYKHFLHGGVGIRQICDLGMMAEKDGGRTDWKKIRSACEELHIETFAAALFRITERHLGFAMPEAFADFTVDESDLLADCLSGGLYGVLDIDRAHSSTMTLEAVGAERRSRRRRGVLHSVFLPLSAMRGHFPYLNKYPWLLPVAWIQRIWRYLRRKQHRDPIHPTRSVRIARERIELLREYRIIE